MKEKKSLCGEIGLGLDLFLPLPAHFSLLHFPFAFLLFHIEIPSDDDPMNALVLYANVALTLTPFFSMSSFHLV